MTTAEQTATLQTPAMPSEKIWPTRFAHAVFKTSRYRVMVDWYLNLLNAHVVFGSESLTFMTYDDEHHRIAIINMPGLQDQSPLTSGLEHISYTYGSLGDLLANYERLNLAGVVPYWCINHGPTTSLYYRDPDGNQVETQFDNFNSVKELHDFFHSDAFAANPIGVDFSPTLLLELYRAGTPVSELSKRGAAPVPGQQAGTPSIPPALR